MDNYLTTFRKMPSLRSLFDHTLTGYCIYIRAYLDYLEKILRKLPEEVSKQERRNPLSAPAFPLLTGSPHGALPGSAHASAYYIPCTVRSPC